MSRAGQINAAGATSAATLLPAQAARPYPPSWVDRLTAWVERLPGPAWLYYVGLAAVLAFVRAIAAWSAGTYPAGTFFPVHILNAISSVYMLGVLHYLDDRAGKALASFRPVLNVDDAGYERLRFELTTMPARPVLLWSLVGLVFGLTSASFALPAAQAQLLKLFTSPATAVIDHSILGLNWMINAVVAYHTVHQLRLVSRIYTHHTNVSIFETGPLYALSRISAATAVAVLIISYFYAVFWSNLSFQYANDAVVGIAFSLIALVTFLLPLWGAHRLLQDEKTRWKGEVARRIEVVARELHRRTDAGDYSEMANMNDAIDSLVKEQNALDKISTWPWEPETVRAVVTALLLPVILWIVTRVLERILAF